jgi:hypothetical protein
VLAAFDLTNQDLLLVVKVTKTEWSGLHPIIDKCKDGYDCIPWYYWYVHEAIVLDDINGDYKDRKIKFAMLSHADYIKEVKREWYVQLKPFNNMETSEKLGALYYVENQSSKLTINH